MTKTDRSADPLQQLRSTLAAIPPASDSFAVNAVEQLLTAAADAGASDVHLVPVAEGVRILWRIDGVLAEVTTLPHGGANLIARLKVLSGLLTYRTEVPQEGRLQGDASREVRVSTFPTVHGEKGVIRFLSGRQTLAHLDDLGLPTAVADPLRRMLGATSGILLVSGPAGSGKTTTLYACLREILATAITPRAIVTLEDPVEVLLNGVAQSQVQPSRGFDYVTGLRSLMRQDPEVILVGEIRDREIAATVFQASLTGHFVLSSIHAGSSAETISRLVDMGIEPYLLRSSLLGVVNQRLLRRRCACDGSEQCSRCHGLGYAGRFPVAELLEPGSPELREAVLDRLDAGEIQRRAEGAGFRPILQYAQEAVQANRTTQEELFRVFGPRGGDRQSTHLAQS